MTEEEFFRELGVGVYGWQMEVLRVLRDLKRGDCWCEVAIGNPMLQGRHTQACMAAKALMEPLGG